MSETRVIVDHAGQFPEPVPADDAGVSRGDCPDHADRLDRAFNWASRRTCCRIRVDNPAALYGFG